MRVYVGDCLAVLRTMPDASIDAIVTDPPYGLAEHKPATVAAAVTAWASGDREQVPDGKGFMGRAWDGFVPPPAVWDECLRVLKPGGHLLCFAGTRTVDLMGLSIRLAGFEIRDSIGHASLMAWVQGQGFPKGKAQLKPAWEPIILARKKGPIWLGIDACRTAAPGEEISNHARGSVSAVSKGIYGDSSAQEKHQTAGQAVGRWPTNVVLSHSPSCADSCDPSCPVAELDRQSGTLKSGLFKPEHADNGKAAGTLGAMSGRERTTATYGDSGGASRFFPVFRYQAKAPTKERPKVDVDGKQIGWPTVKPLELMRWLVRLVTPPGGVVLDPFAGTGTTGQAAQLEGFTGVLIERDELAVRLIRERLAGVELEVVEPVVQLDPTPPTLFDLIAQADGDDEFSALFEAHEDEWTDEHTAMVKQRLGIAA